MLLNVKYKPSRIFDKFIHCLIEKRKTYYYEICDLLGFMHFIYNIIVFCQIKHSINSYE